MSLKIIGQEGGPTELSANDDSFGLLTQVPENAVYHSPDGLSNADGNTAFGTPYKLVDYFEQTTDGTTTVTHCNSDAPYKFRILACHVTMMDDANGVARSANGRLSLSVKSGDNVAFAAQLKDMAMGEERNLPGNTTTGNVVAEGGSLSVSLQSRLPLTNETNTMKMLVELTCIRVI